MAPEPIRTIEPPQITVPRGSGANHTDPPNWFGDALNDAELLLKYAAEIGTAVDADVRDSILQARATFADGWDEATAARVLTALTTLTNRLRPVTAESLKACTSETRPTVRNYWVVAICLAVVIAPFSVASFLSSAISAKVRDDITTANDLAVKLRTQLGSGAPVQGAVKAAPAPNPDDSTIITELQTYAATIRSIYQRGRELNALILWSETDPYSDIRDITKKDNKKALHDTFELPLPLSDFSKATNDKTAVYQDVRYFAQSALDDVSFFYGAFATCLLPALYALLGTCAYLLRTFEQQMAAKTFVPSTADSARFLIAAIGGAVVGLFSNFTIGQAASIPPLAIAFLVGYAVDVFFAFLEGMLQPFTRNAGSPSSNSSAGAKA
ncbi:MAG TPA: hypothetical protein VK789_00305 [Bryobacteraceae bacterium]|nr:hypothetical protein [Bryobacteraceae bacterium]